MTLMTRQSIHLAWCGRGHINSRRSAVAVSNYVIAHFRVRKVLGVFLGLCLVSQTAHSQDLSAIIAETTRLSNALAVAAPTSRLTIVPDAPTVSTSTRDLVLGWTVTALQAAQDVHVWVALPVETTYGAINPGGSVGFPLGDLAAGTMTPVKLTLHLRAGLQVTGVPIVAIATATDTPPVMTSLSATSTISDAQRWTDVTAELAATVSRAIAAIHP